MMADALEYAKRGWPVFPCRQKDKRPLTPAAEGGSGGLKLATTNIETIKAWWTRWPKAMIGVPTGNPIKAFVVDLDAGIDKNTGEVFEFEDLLRRLESKIGTALPRTWMSKTPRGGRHVFFAMPEGKDIGNRAGLIDRVDIRGTGGYVVVPPSRRLDGASYDWVVAPW